VIFAPADPVLWNGDACTVTVVRGDSVALNRDSDGFTVITTAEILAGHQYSPKPPRMPRASLLGDA
jgi:hypothetical protein